LGFGKTLFEREHESTIDPDHPDFRKSGNWAKLPMGESVGWNFGDGIISMRRPLEWIDPAV
jgi:hypothetical protein